MQYCCKSRVKDYLTRFEEILNTMSYKMLKACNDDKITIYFIRCMIPHHQAAIYMCENLLKYTKYEPLQNIAKNIITMQENGIKKMKEIELCVKGFDNSPKDIECYTSKYCDITNIMLYKMRKSPKCLNIDLNFTNEMLPHHEGAIKMCENLLEYDIDPRLKEIACSIIEEQSEGVKKLEKIRLDICNSNEFKLL